MTYTSEDVDLPISAMFFEPNRCNSKPTALVFVLSKEYRLNLGKNKVLKNKNIYFNWIRLNEIAKDIIDFVLNTIENITLMLAYLRSFTCVSIQSC